MDEVTPCVGCERKYGHLSGCAVELLHRQLDAMIRSNGPASVRIVLEPPATDESTKGSSLV
jgi:hypothetical protein